jgi:hypothetical protein
VSQNFLTLFPAAGENAFTENLLLRADLNYFAWEDTITVPFVGTSFDIEMTRLPLFLGGRYVLPQKLGNSVIMYAEGGFEISFDAIEAAVCVPFVPCVPTSEDEVNFGITPGFGLAMPITNNLIAGVNGRFHVIADTYFSLMATVGFKLGN